MTLKVLQPKHVTVMIKPVGALCNLDCTYCYYLPTKTIYDGKEHRMRLDVLESIFASLLPQSGDEVIIGWQGGEPTLAGLDFFRKAIEFQNKYRRPGQIIRHTIQTNGTLLDEEWCKFLKQHEFLVGFSIDGPPKFHDHYRVTNRQKPSSKKVFAGLRQLQKHKVQFNLLCVLNDVNVYHPDEVFDYLLSLGTPWVQFIPAIEWEKSPDDPNENVLAPYSPDPAAYGDFLCRVFDRWFESKRDKLSVRIFDAVLNRMVLNETPLCILDGRCHSQLTIEHDGAVFGCDHFVERRWQLGKIGEPGWENAINLDGSANVGLTVHGSGYDRSKEHEGTDIDSDQDVRATAAAPKSPLDVEWLEHLDMPRLDTFADRKQHLPDKCLKCEFKRFCYGGCPKHRPHGGDTPEPSILCEAYLKFFRHSYDRFEWLAGFLRQNRQPPPAKPPSRKKERRPRVPNVRIPTA